MLQYCNLFSSTLFYSTLLFSRLLFLVSSSLFCMSPRIGWLQFEVNDVRTEALFYCVGLHSTPRTFRFIIGTTTNEIKCGYGQLPRKEADTNNRRQAARPGESLRSLHF